MRKAFEGRPSVLHFAVHVLRAPDQTTNAMIALGLDETGASEFLGPAEIPTWKGDADLVVLSGCGSGVAVAPPATGLMGLTRAWLMAGAASVVASRWSTPDDSGELFRKFYEHLQNGTRGAA